MSLPVLVAIVALGIGLTVLAVHLTGGSAIATIANADHARQILFADFPDERPELTEITTDRHSAFMRLPGERIGIVQSFGDGFFTRIVSSRDIAAIRLRDPATVSIRFRDFTWTGGHFSFAGEDQAKTIVAALDPNATGQKA